MAGYVRTDKEYSYSGVVAAFTAPLILFYNVQMVLTPELARLTSISRIEATVLVLMIVLVVTVLWPMRAARALR